jgi:Ni/Fe-hydrogenase subunit HybB-like protein
MMDALPWGWWKVFNMIAGAALATSGFVIAAIIYIFDLKQFRAVARISVLVGFLGYGTSLMALGFDVGLPHRGWHPLFMWNPHSFLFEVFWCVSLYWGVTALELLPILTERFSFPRLTHVLHEIMLPFVVLGVTLSTMHHSSLGALFLASPTRLHPLWHSMWIPPEFFISAMGAGLATMVLLMLVLAWLFGREFDRGVLTRLAGSSAIFLSIYGVIKVVDLTVHNKWTYVFGPDKTWESSVFLVEIGLQVILPVLIFAIPVLRRNKLGLFVGSLAAFLGLVMHRLDVGIVGYFRSANAVYIPTAGEFILSFGLLSGAGLLFLFLVEKFPVLSGIGFGYSEDDGHDSHGEAQAPVWTMQEALALLKGPGAERVLVIALIVIPFAWFGLKGQGTSAYEPIRSPVERGVQTGDPMREMLRIDANRNGDYVEFGHKKHQEVFQEKYELAEKETCVKCHHLTLPKDNNTVCRACHSDMALPMPMFRAERHEERFEDDKQRARFAALDLDRRKQNFEACMICHEETMIGLAAYELKGFDQMAPGFKDAMHGNCMTCHRLEEKDPTDPFSTGNCLGCHRPQPKPEGEVMAELQSAESGPAAEEPVGEPLHSRVVIIPSEKNP